MTRFHPRRPLGQTGFVATRVGAGDLADRNVPIEQCVATLVRALDAGVNVGDTAECRRANASRYAFAAV